MLLVQENKKKTFQYKHGELDVLDYLIKISSFIQEYNINLINSNTILFFVSSIMHLKKLFFRKKITIIKHYFRMIMVVIRKYSFFNRNFVFNLVTKKL